MLLRKRKKDDYEDLGDVYEASTPIGPNDTFHDLFNEDSRLSPEKAAMIEREQEQGSGARVRDWRRRRTKNCGTSNTAENF